VNQSEQEVWLHIARRRNSVTICNSADDLNKLFAIEYFHPHVEALTLIAKRFEEGPFTVCVLSELDILHDCIFQADTSSSAACFEFLGDTESSPDEDTGSDHSSKQARFRYLTSDERNCETKATSDSGNVSSDLPVDAAPAAPTPTVPTDAAPMLSAVLPELSSAHRDNSSGAALSSAGVSIPNVAPSADSASQIVVAESDADRLRNVGVDSGNESPSEESSSALSSDSGIDEDVPDKACVAEALPFPASEVELCTPDYQRQFEKHVCAFIHALRQEADVSNALLVAGVPSTCPYHSTTTCEDSLRSMNKDFQRVKEETLGVDEFVDTFAPLWLCHSYQPVVIMEGLARSICIPTAMLLGALKCVLSPFAQANGCRMGSLQFDSKVLGCFYYRPWLS